MTHTLKSDYSTGHQVQLTLLRNYLCQSGFLSQEFPQSEVFFTCVLTGCDKCIHFLNSHSTAEGKLEGVAEEEENVCSYWISLRTTDNTELQRGNNT